MSNSVRDLDRALNGSTATIDEELAEMLAVGEEIRSAYTSFTPGHSAQRALFVGAVSEKATPPRRMRFLAPVAVTGVLLLGLLFLGRAALPGGTFYPVRQVLRSVGLAPASLAEVRGLLVAADRLLDEAEILDPRDIPAAKRLAFEAVKLLGMAEAAFADLEVDERALVADELSLLLKRAEAILTDEPKATSERGDRKASRSQGVGDERSAAGRDNASDRGSNSNPNGVTRGGDRNDSAANSDRGEDGRARSDDARSDDGDTETKDDNSGSDGRSTGGGGGAGMEEKPKDEELEDDDGKGTLERTPTLPSPERKPPKD